MGDAIQPRDADDLLDAVRWAAGAKAPLDIVGTGTKAALGRPVQSAATLDTNRLSGIREYEAAELVMTAGAATPIAEGEGALNDAGQMLAFEPMDPAALLGGAAGGGTLGGILAANLSGPRRIKAGAARDHFLGFEGVSGRGEAFKAGGRVVKNVTGYDLCKLMAGSWGTLGVLHTVSLKVLPRPEKTRTVLVFGLDERRAVDAFGVALASPNEPSAAAWLPAAHAGGSGAAHVAGAGVSVTAIRVEGVGVSVAARCADLRDRLGALGETEELHSTNSLTFWREVRDVLPFAADRRPVWRLSVPPAAGGALTRRLVDELGADAFMDWGGGLIWAALAEGQGSGDAAVAAAGKVHHMATEAGGHATCIRVAAELRGVVEVFPPRPAGETALARRIKEGFDPHGILNPGRMYAGL